MNLDVSSLSCGQFDLQEIRVTGAGARRVPIIENLTSQNMSSHPPAILIPLFDQPVVPQHVRVEIKHLERRVVYVRFGPLKEEEAVVVDEFVSAVQMHERGDVAALSVVEQIGRFEVEVAGPEVERLGKVGDAHAEVAEFVDLGWAFWGGGGRGSAARWVVGGWDGRARADLFAFVGTCSPSGVSRLAAT